MDVITTGNVLAFAMECNEKRIIANKELAGLQLAFGNHEAMITTIGKIAHREGFGNVLAEGVRKAAEITGKGSERFAIHVKGLEPPGYDPRGLKGVALAYAVSCRGACHLRHLTYRPNLTGSHPFTEGAKIDRLSYRQQTEIVRQLEDFYTIVDSMVLCKFVCLPTIGPILWNELTRLYYIITGLETTKQEMIEKAEGIERLIALFNAREGATKEDDRLPERFMKEGLKNGASKGEVVLEDEFDRMLDDHYKTRG
jgi:aldehyde:ferredoxin oxidoreductase